MPSLSISTWDHSRIYQVGQAHATHTHTHAHTHTHTHTHTHSHTHTHTSCIFFTLGTLLLLLFPDEVNCKAVVPLKRQIGFLNLTRQLLQSLKEKLEPHLSAIMPVLLTMVSYCAQLLSTQRDQVNKVDQEPRYYSICIYVLFAYR